MLFSGAAISMEVPQQIILLIQPPPAADTTVSVRELALDGRGEPREGTVLIKRGQERASMRLRTGAWMVEASAEGYWAPRVPVGAGLSAEVTLLRMAIVSGITDTPTVRDFALRLEQLPGNRKPPTTSTFPCGLNGKEFSCAAPAGPWGFSLRKIGFVANYFLAETLSGPKRLKEAVAFEPGASLAGWLSCEDVNWKPASALVRIAKKGHSSGPKQFTAAVQPPGFFQIRRLEPGEYQVVGMQDGFAPDSRPVQVIKDSESFLIEPLVLAKAVTLELTVVPPLDPNGRPWQAEILERVARGGNTVGGGNVVDGRFIWAGLKKDGEYSVWLKTSTGQRWSAEESTFRADKPKISRQIDAGMEAIVGEVLIAEKPLQAKLTFGVGSNLEILLNSNEAGRFTGFLPRLGRWRVKVESTDKVVVRSVEANAVRGANGVATASIELDDFRARGVLVDERDQLYNESAIVSVVFPGKESFQRFVTGGRFELGGLPTGSLDLRAEAEGLISDTVSTTSVSDEAPDEIRIVLKKRKTLIVDFLGVNGNPLAGITVAILPS